MPGGLDLEFNFRQFSSQSDTRVKPDSMRILIMGDFSGHQHRTHSPESATIDHPIPVLDIDDLNRALSRISPGLKLTLDDQSKTEIEISFQCMDDFHPDEIYKNVPLFQSLKETKRKLSHPETFAQAAAEFGYPSEQAAESTKTIPVAAEEVLPEDSDSMFERLLGRPSTQNDTKNSEISASQQKNIAGLIKEIVAPYIDTTADRDPLQDQYIDSMDRAAGEQMRSLLHHPGFQSLEANWRSLQWLLSNLETGETLKLYLLDITKAELLLDIKNAGGQLESSNLYRQLVMAGPQTLGGENWDLLVGGYDFGPGADDLYLLAALGTIGSQCGGPFIAAASPEILGCSSLHSEPDPREWEGHDTKVSENWMALRRSPAAPWIGLVIPRILLRLPYGRNTDELEQFTFEEISAEPRHEEFLWGNPAFACALLIAQAFQDNGWEMEPGDMLEIEDLPSYSYETGGEPSMLPCAELFLTERAGSAIMEHGIMPIASYQNRNSVRVIRFQSIAEPLRNLVGPWG